MKDATIEVISDVIKHPNADRLDIVKILGFECVTAKGLYNAGDKIVYIRPDSVLPMADWAEEYRKYSPKRIKCVKLRNYWSEGVIVPLNILPIDLTLKEIGEDVTDLIGVNHYEPPIPQDLSAKGYLPHGIGKTDEILWQNFRNGLPYGELVDNTLKADGQSCTYYYHFSTKEFGVLGRTLEIKLEAVNNYTAHITKYDIKNKLISFCEKNEISLAIRGESYGQGIQNFAHNPHAKKEKGWAMFSVYLIDEKRYANKGEPFYFTNVAKQLELPTVDILEENVILTPELVQKYAVGITEINGHPFEGVVIKHANGSFKIINKHYDSLK